MTQELLARVAGLEERLRLLEGSTQSPSSSSSSSSSASSSMSTILFSPETEAKGRSLNRSLTELTENNATIESNNQDVNKKTSEDESNESDGETQSSYESIYAEVKKPKALKTEVINSAAPVKPPRDFTVVNTLELENNKIDCVKVTEREIPRAVSTEKLNNMAKFKWLVETSGVKNDPNPANRFLKRQLQHSRSWQGSHSFGDILEEEESNEDDDDSSVCPESICSEPVTSRHPPLQHSFSFPLPLQDTVQQF